MKIEDLSYTERKEVARLFGNWLKKYTGAVVVKVMARSEEILNNEFAMHLLKELSDRQDKEEKAFVDHMESLLEHYDDFKEYDPHNNPLEHSNSYRDVLYDMYIR